MLQLNQIRMLSGEHHDYPISDDDIDNLKISVVIIVTVFVTQLAFGGLALLGYWLNP
jgi:hypothetical protein